MFKRLLLALALSFIGTSAWAQNPTCPTRSIGDNSNACASTAYVQNQIVADSPEYIATNFGVVCDGTTINTKLQTLINTVITAGGGTIVLPVGVCLEPTGLIEDLSSYSSAFKPIVNIRGQGPAVTTIQTNGFTGAALQIKGNSTNDETFLVLSDFALNGNSTSASTGLLTSDTAYLTLRNISVSNFTNGWSASDLEQSSIENSIFQYNINGVALNGAVNATGSNSISFYNTAIANNTSAGLLVRNFAAFAYFNGSIQYNGATGVSGEHGALFQDTAGGSFCGYNTVNFYSTIFEGNGGDYDLAMSTTFCPGAALNLYGTSFIRTQFNSTLHYATNNIFMAGTEPQNLQVSGTTFLYGTGYTPNAGRPVIALSNTAAVLNDNGTNFYQSALEAPAITINHPGPGFNQVGSSGLYSLAFGYTVEEPIEFLASAYYMQEGPLTLGGPSSGCTNCTPAQLKFLNATSGSISIEPPTGALGTQILTLPDTTDTLVAIAATQTLSGKSLTTPILTVFTIAGLPTCVSGLKGAMAFVSDTVASGAPTYHGTVTGGGATTINTPVSCTGAAWQYD